MQPSLIKTATNRMVATGFFKGIIPALTNNNPYKGALLTAIKRPNTSIVSRRISHTFCVAYVR